MVSRVVTQEILMETAEEMAAKILRNNAWAIRSAKETIFNVIGRTLDDQLVHEAVMAYSALANPTVSKLLENFAEKTDKGRVGRNKTEL